MKNDFLDKLFEHTYGYFPLRQGGEKMKENKKIISPDEFKKKMKEIQIALDAGLLRFNKEEAHIKMDDLMCEVLISLGYEEGIEVFDNTGKWYS